MGRVQGEAGHRGSPQCGPYSSLLGSQRLHQQDSTSDLSWSPEFPGCLTPPLSPQPGLSRQVRKASFSQERKSFVLLDNLF